MMRFSILVVFFSFFISSCSGAPATANGGPRIEPQDCKLTSLAQISLSLSGVIPPNSRIIWQANGGNILQAGTGFTATYIAPAQPGIYRITVSAEEPGREPRPLASVDCTVIEPTSTPPPKSSDIPYQPTPSPTASLENSPTPYPLPSPTTTPVTAMTLIITEFMGNPCGNDEIDLYNQYIELYNYGKFPVDVAGLWLYSGIAQKIIAWDEHEPDLLPLQKGLITSSTIIPPGGFALILSPRYPLGPVPYNMPYSIPENTIILTVEGNKLGWSKFGIIGHGQGRDVLVLYRGGQTVLSEVVSTYGTPLINPFIDKIRDDYRDALPFDLPECRSANLKDIAKGDVQPNWELISGGTPGEGPYHPLP